MAPSRGHHRTKGGPVVTAVATNRQPKWEGKAFRLMGWLDLEPQRPIIKRSHHNAPELTRRSRRRLQPKEDSDVRAAVMLFFHAVEKADEKETKKKYPPTRPPARR